MLSWGRRWWWFLVVERSWRIRYVRLPILGGQQQRVTRSRRGATTITTITTTWTFVQMLELYFRFNRQSLDILRGLFLHLLYPLRYLQT